MKKVFSTLLVASMFAIVACGPSAEQKAAAEKATQDSIAAAEQALIYILEGRNTERIRTMTEPGAFMMNHFYCAWPGI